MQIIKNLKIQDVKWTKYLVISWVFIIYTLLVFVVWNQSQWEKMKTCKEIINTFDSIEESKSALIQLDKMTVEYSKKVSEDSQKISELLLNLKNKQWK